MKTVADTCTFTTVVRKCNRPALFLFRNLLTAYYTIRGIRVRTINKCGKKLDGPCIVLCNHGSFIDFYYATKLLKHTDFNFITARLYFYHNHVGKLLKNLGCFPKSMFTMDLESIKNSMRVIKDGRVLAMMPEARLSTVGTFEDIQPGTFSFIKKTGVPVYSIVMQGNYFAFPKWGKGFRRGAYVEAEMDILFTAEMLQNLSVEQIQTAIEDRLYYDEFAWLAANPHIHYRNKNLAVGLENILTLCPQCGQHHTLHTKGMTIYCDQCGQLTQLDDRYSFLPGFRFQNFAQWYNWQKETLAKEIENNPDYSISSRVQLHMADPTGKHMTTQVGSGTCTLDATGLTYTGTCNDAPCTQFFPLNQIYRLLFGAGENFEVYKGAQIYYFVPEDRRSAVDWYMASTLLYDTHCKNG